MIRKQAFSKTMITGKHSSIILKEDVRNAKISEVRKTDPDGNPLPIWEMEIGKL